MSIPAPCGNVKHFVTPRRVAYGDRFRWATCYVTICDMTAHVAERRGALSEVVVLQTISRGKPAYGWECPCGAGGGPFAALQTAATVAEYHEQWHARARELTVERFLTAPVFS